MRDTITVDELTRMLERREPLTIVDVRAAEDVADWTIPGSVNVDAYDALAEGKLGPLETFRPPRDGPVVTVCYAGNTSSVAARLLRERGIDARNLAGGMQAWSLAWNTAEVPLTKSRARVLQVRRVGKGCLSYLVSSGTRAIVIDPSLPPEVYQRIAKEKGLRIEAVLETHVHADHLSRARLLTVDASARLHMPRTPRVGFAYEPVDDGDVIQLGTSRIEVVATPGHTDESTCYLLDGEALFTGDTLFPNSVGRPDLEADDAGRTRRAVDLHASLGKLAKLPDDALVLAAHESGPIPFDGRPRTARLRDVRKAVPLLRLPRDAFVREVLGRVPPTPPNHHEIVHLNETGAWPEDDPATLEAGANRCAIQ